MIFPPLNTYNSAVTILRDIPMISPSEQPTFIQIRGLVARALLEHADDGAGGRVVQRDIAETVGTDWGNVHISLKSMQEQGAIRIERNRMFINKEELRKLAGTICSDTEKGRHGTPED
jgi:hypothetical protein